MRDASPPRRDRIARVGRSSSNVDFLSDDGEFYGEFYEDPAQTDGPRFRLSLGWIWNESHTVLWPSGSLACLVLQEDDAGPRDPTHKNPSSRLTSRRRYRARSSRKTKTDTPTAPSTSRCLLVHCWSNVRESSTPRWRKSTRTGASRQRISSTSPAISATGVITSPWDARPGPSRYFRRRSFARSHAMIDLNDGGELQVDWPWHLLGGGAKTSLKGFCGGAAASSRHRRGGAAASSRHRRGVVAASSRRRRDAAGSQGRSDDSVGSPRQDVAAGSARNRRGGTRAWDGNQSLPTWRRSPNAYASPRSRRR